jgi:ABC-type glycerol-3-phosphate transport system permease component
MSKPEAKSPSRIARYFVAHGWLHLVLLTGVGIFIFPFLWMLITSLKTDDELVAASWIPSIPRFVGQSPYVLETPDLAKPLEVDEKTWEARLPTLLSATESYVRSHLTPEQRADVDVDALVRASSAVLMNRAVARVPTEAWKRDERELLHVYQSVLSPALSADAIDSRLSRLEITGLQLRTLDNHVFVISRNEDVTETMRVESGDASIIRDGEKTYLRYRFESGSSKPIILSMNFILPAPMKNLHKLTIGWVTDNSWHRVSASLDVEGKLWRSSRRTELAQHKLGSLMLQPPTYEDDTLRPKIWVPLRDAGPTQRHGMLSNEAILTLTLYPSSTPRAIWTKVQRNFSRVFDQIPFWKYALNSLLLVGLSTIGALFSACFVAYAFARLHWPGRSVALILLLSTMMLPSQVTMIPQFLIWRQLGWYNTLNPLWVPSFLGGAFFIFLMTQHMKTIPRELEEAARIDGLNAVQTWWYVILPLVKPAAAAIAIMAIQWAWNDFMGPLIYLRDQDRFPLSLGLFALSTEQRTSDFALLMAGNVLMTLPMLIMFLIFQRYFIQGMTMSGMKG